MIRLLRNTSNQAVVEWTADRASNSKYTELSEEDVRGYYAGKAAVPGSTIALDPKDGILMHLSSTGIGDAVVGLYAACGFAEAGYPTTFYARHLPWIGAASHPNLTLKPVPLVGTLGVDGNQRYVEQLKAAYAKKLPSRAHWFIEHVAKAYRIKPPPPARPQSIAVEGEWTADVVLSPFAIHACRNWPIANYARVASLLRERGVSTLAVMPAEAAKDDEYILNVAGAKVWRGASPGEVMRAIAGARLLVGGDSGMAHIGGLLQVPTLAIMAQAGVRYTFWCGDSVQGIV
ncbi:MAG: hypothetical protein RL375_2903, partial [Pseudomonadota bacterium]